MPLLLLVRHGQASFGAADYDVLSERGGRQATLTAAAILAAGVPVSRVVSGALQRQRGTAAAIAEATGRDVTIDAGWDEYDADPILRHHSATVQRLEHPGDGAAQPTSPREFQAVFERALDAWIAAGADTPAPESWPAFVRRTTTALATAARATPSGEVTVACTSGGVIAALCVALTGATPTSFMRFNRVMVNCSISRVIVGTGGSTLLSFNEQQHLTGEDLTYR